MDKKKTIFNSKTLWLLFATVCMTGAGMISGELSLEAGLAAMVMQVGLAVNRFYTNKPIEK